MRRTTPVALGLVAAMALLIAVLAVPVAAERGHLPGWRGSTRASQTTAGEARVAAEGWLEENGYGEMVVADLIEVDGRAYVVVDDAQGRGAFELFVSRNGGWVHPAPTMMWNTSYDLMTTMMTSMPHGDMMGGMGAGMTGGNHQHDQHGTMSGGMMDDHEMTGMMDTAACQGMMGVPAADPLAEPLTLDEATAAAQAWLDANQSGATAANPVEFPGYVTLRVSTDGAVTGLIAVQLTTGAVWPLQ